MPARGRRRFLVAGVGAVLLLGAVRFGNDLCIALESGAPSRSTGTPSAGTLLHGKRLPSDGPNFQAYSRLAALLGRNALHGTIRSVVLDAYAAVAARDSSLTFVYGETGWPGGGSFAPHRTHRNGLSVDFMAPVRDAAGRPVPLPTAPWTRFGYDLEFDASGAGRGLRIDFEAMALHLEALERAARARGSRIELLILAPEYHRLLWQTTAGRRLAGRVPVLPGAAWVRHDEHYHVDFANPG